jgi:hypothetical protein
VALASATAAIRLAPGPAAIKISCGLPSGSGESKLIPVTLPPRHGGDFPRGLLEAAQLRLVGVAKRAPMVRLFGIAQVP